MLSRLIPAHNRLHFSHVMNLCEQIRDRVEQCLSTGSGCYVLVRGVDFDTIQAINHVFSHMGVRKALRFTYENVIRSLIMRIMPGPVHEGASRSIYSKIEKKIENIPGHEESIYPVGSSQFTVPRRRGKQGDESLRPLGTRPLWRDWPSVTIEVGYSESLRELQCDAAWWLENPDGKTRMVIIVKVGVDPPNIRVEAWEMYRDQTRRVTRSTAPKPSMRQSFEVNDTGAILPPDAELIIPYEAIFDTCFPGYPPYLPGEDPPVPYQAPQLPCQAPELPPPYPINQVPHQAPQFPVQYPEPPYQPPTASPPPPPPPPPPSPPPPITSSTCDLTVWASYVFSWIACTQLVSFLPISGSQLQVS